VKNTQAYAAEAPRTRVWGLVLTSAAALSACAVGPDYVRPTAEVPAAYKTTRAAPPVDPPQGQWKQATPGSTFASNSWWELYGDAQLNELEAKVPISNQTLQASYQAYLQAREQVSIDRASLFPMVGLSTGAARARASANRPLALPGAKNVYNDFSLDGAVSWEPDLWGSVRRQVEAAQALSQASSADLANVRLSLQAELAIDYFQLRGVDSQLTILYDTIEAYRKSVDLTSRRLRVGFSSASDLALAQTQLDQTIAQATDLEVARSQYENAIATLTGVPAATFALPRSNMTAVIPPVPVGLPSELLERRPDIAGAERRVAAANARIGVAQAAFYPTLSLRGAGGFESTNAANWLQGPSALWALGASAAETLFDAGRRHAVKHQAIAACEEDAANYRQTVLQAFEEVENSLAAGQILAREAVEQGQAVADASRSVRLSTELYKKGLTSYLQIITVQTALLANRRDAVDIEVRQATSSVQVFKALGGGWNMRDPAW
jgi:NodT family efflux transporter outer membrane factor (OMF) lipoprotein